MLKKILPILLAVTVLLEACAPQAAPTMAPVDVQNTAVAAAWAIVTMTQGAIPTNTPAPPTETPSPTPLPTFTAPPAVIPTLDPLLLAPTVAPTAGTSDPNNCVKALNVAEAGPTKNVRIENTTGNQVNLSLNLYTPNLFGQCGSLSYVVKKNEKRKIAIPSGSWYAYSWVNGPGGGTGEVSFYIGPSKSQDLLRLVIKKDIIAWIGP